MEGKRPLSTSTAAATAAPSSTAEPILLGTQHDQDESTNGSSTAASSPPTTPGTPPPNLAHGISQPTPVVPTLPSMPPSGATIDEGTPMEVGGLRSLNTSPGTTTGLGIGLQGATLLGGSLGPGTGSGGSGGGLLASVVPSSSPTTPQSKQVELEIAPTTGGSFTFVIDPNESIEGLKKAIGKRLKVGKEHICLLHRDRLLESSKRIRDYGLADGSRVSLVPSVETGLLTQRPEQSVLEALEGLNETQVGDFLSGKSPLNLTMRLGDHVMLIQLQLSKGTKSGSTTASTSSSSTAAAASTAPAAAPAPSIPSISTATSTQSTSSTPSVPTPTPTPAPESTARPSTSTSATQTSPSTSYEHDRLNTLAEASRNLSNTLKKLSSHVIKEDDDSITNHMQHHGKGVYSGTFSGTLNPALQDGLGKPKKHVSTIIHILNDLLGGMDPGKCSHMTATSGSGLSSSSLSTELHNRRRLLRRRQPEHHRKSDSQGNSQSSSYNPSIPGSPQDTMKKSKLANTDETYSSVSSPSGDDPCDHDHQYHRCSTSAASQTSSPGGGASPTVNRERENEQLRLKMERIKESLRLRKEKMLLRNNSARNSAGAGSGGAAATTSS